MAVVEKEKKRKGRRRKEGREEESEEDMSTVVSNWEYVSPGGVCQMMHTSHLL